MNSEGILQSIDDFNKKNIEILETLKNKKSIKEFRDRDFSEYCEYVVAFKLQELGWEVYQPLSDRYIDIVAYREIDDKQIIRTIQVKGSRIELEGKKQSYGLTHKPKDLMHDKSHFFIWLFFDSEEKENFIILSVSNFIDIMGKGLKTKSWRKGNDRIHFSSNLEKLKPHLNNWDKLLKEEDIDVSKRYIEFHEIEKKWRGKDENIIRKWKKTNEKIIKKIPREMIEKIRRKTEIGE